MQVVLARLVLIALAFGLCGHTQAEGLPDLSRRIRTVDQPLVKAGTPALPSDYPEVVAVEVNDVVRQVKRICTGIAVRDDVVITAAHCAYGKIKPVRVISGTDAFAVAGTKGIQFLEVRDFKVMNPEATSAGRRLMGTDLMIVFLSASFKAPVLPVAIPALTALENAKNLRIAGFGENGKGMFGTKLYADVPLEVARCRAGSAISASCAEGEAFLKRQDGKFDACPGDSGGPAYVLNEDGKYMLVGVLSRSTSTTTRCGGGTIVTLLDGPRLDFLTANGVAVQATRPPIRPSNVVCAPPPIC